MKEKARLVLYRKQLTEPSFITKPKCDGTLERRRREFEASLNDLHPFVLTPRRLKQHSTEEDTISIKDSATPENKDVQSVKKSCKNCEQRHLRPIGTATKCEMKECNVKFTTINKRYHCRCCGKIMCSDCSSWAPIYGNEFRSERVCKPCYSSILYGWKPDSDEPPLKQVGSAKPSDQKHKRKKPKHTTGCVKINCRTKSRVKRREQKSVPPPPRYTPQPRYCYYISCL